MVEFIYCVAFVLLWRMSDYYGDSLLEYLRGGKAKYLLLIDIKKQKLGRRHKVSAKEIEPGVWQLTCVPRTPHRKLVQFKDY